MGFDEEELSKLAYDEVPPESALPHEWLLWYRLRDIYADVRAGRLVMQAGQAKKQTAVNSFHSAREMWERNERLWQRIERAATAYAKAETHTPEADAFYEALYGTRPGIGTAGHMKEEA